MMKPKYLLIPFALGLALALVWVLGGRGGAAVAAPSMNADGPPEVEGPGAQGRIEAPSAPAADLRVCLDGCLYSSVQDAVDAAAHGDVIKVATGTYTGVQVRAAPTGFLYLGPSVITQMVYISKTVTIRGGYTIDNWTTSDPENNPTTLDAQGQGRVLFIAGNISPTIEGLRITGGDAAGLGGPSGREAGGGAYVVAATATISDNRVFNNTADYGGGLELYSSDATLSGNIVTSNTAYDYGGGLWLYSSDATLNGNTITSNTAYDGGGLYLRESDAMLSGNIVTNNSAHWGGGLYLYSSNATLSGNTVTSNTAYYGGGLDLYSSDVTLINNVVADNQADDRGSGLYVSESSPRLLHNTIARNSGGDGVGVYVITYGREPSIVALTNTILVNHTMGVYVESGSTATLESTLWNGNATNWSGGGTVEHSNDCAGDPDFVDPDAGDYHIRPGSVAIDAGVNAGVTPLCLYDIDGDPRPAAFGPDIGADEQPGISLHVRKVAWSLFLNSGQTVTYTTAITSAGVDAATDVQVTDILPALQRAVVIATSQGNCMAGAEWGGTATCDVGTLAPRAGARITLTAQVTTTPPAQLPRPMRNTAWVTATEASNSTYADTTLHDCHVRLNDDPVEYSTIQAGVDASTQPTDVVKVAGYCVGVTSRAGVAQIVYLDKTLVLQGGWNTAFTQRNVTGFPATLDARGQGRVLYVTGDISPTIEGLRITGGDAAGLSRGGGVYVVAATATISDNRVFNNAAHEGGGFFLYESDATLSGNTVTNNSAHWSGGGLYLHGGDATLSGNTVTSNTAYYGGGLYLHYSNDTLNGNTITNNTADDGGGLCLYESDAVLDSNIVSNNAASDGGGLYLHYSNDTLSGNTITNNTASDGGGLYLKYSDATSINNVVADNQANDRGSGLYVGGSSLHLLQTTITRNSASGGSGDRRGVYVDKMVQCSRSSCWIVRATVALTNTVLVGHGVGISVTGDNTATVNGVLWHDVSITVSQSASAFVTMQNQHTGNPAFVDPDSGNYHIGPGSAAIDAGVDAGVDHDIDGEPRPLGSGYDLGADEVGLFVTKQASPGWVQPGAPLTYTIRITNVTGVDLHATITDTLPEQVTPGRTSGEMLPLPGGVVTWTPVSIPPQQAWTGTVVVTVEEDLTGPLVNVVEVATEEGATGRYVHTLVPDLEVSKRAHADTVHPGERLTYTIAVTNTGDLDLRATITDTLPPHVTTGGTAGGTTVLPGGKLVWTPVITTPGGVWRETAVVTAEQGYEGPLVNLVEVTTREGTAGRAVVIVNAHKVYLPLVLRSFLFTGARSRR